MNDEHWMQMALAESEKARLISPPNPWVGSVVVKEGKLIGKGFTQPPGKQHAEIMALQDVKNDAKDASLYVTLEPCSHWGRTPPCADAVIAAGIRRVVIALEDPDPKVKGEGIRRLRQAGIEVVLGIGKEQAERILAPYLFHRKFRRPFCLLKSAMSLDGRIAAQDGTSQWITDPLAREDGHRLRAYSQGILVGAGTAQIDRPQLTARHPTLKPLNNPLRIICDASGRVEPIGPLFEPSISPTLIFTSIHCHAERLREWKKTGVEIQQVPCNHGKLDLDAILASLAERGILQLLVEGGPTIQSAFIKAKLAQQWTVYVGNCLLGETGKPLLARFQVDTIKNAPRIQLESCEKLGDSSKLTFSFL